MISDIRKKLIDNDKELKRQKIESRNKAKEYYSKYQRSKNLEDGIKSKNQKNKDSEISKQNSLIKELNKTTELIYVLEIEAESQKAASLFFLGLIFSIGAFLVLWFLSFNFSILGDYLNKIFCRIKTQ